MTISSPNHPIRLSRRQWIFLAILSLAVFERLFLFGSVPYGLNQDEAYAGYNAWSLLREGIDSRGDAFPVYFEAWGHGMNALETYLMLPFVAVFGLKVWVIRIPQMLVGILTVPAVYGIVKRISGGRLALIAMALTAIAPWHIMLSRWGLESNLLPGFLSFGLYFFVRGFENPKFLILSGLFYGLSLYAYATVWPLLPFLILLEVLYALWTKRLSVSKYLILGGAVLGILALPLILFLLVNEGLLPEVQTPFFSIPKMHSLRTDEFSLSYLKLFAVQLWKVVIGQDDGKIWNCTEKFGLYYHFSVVFLFFGLLIAIFRGAKHLKKREFAPEPILLMYLAAGGILGLLLYSNANRVNIVFLPILILVAMGLDTLCTLLHKIKPLPILLGGIYLVSLILFNGYYFSREYRKDAEYGFMVGFEEALDVADQAEGTVYFPEYKVYPLVLFYRQIPASTYQAANAENEDLYDFGRYQRMTVSQDELNEDNVDPNGIYILPSWDEDSYFSKEKYTLTQCGAFYAAVPKTRGE